MNFIDFVEYEDGYVGFVEGINALALGKAVTIEMDGITFDVTPDDSLSSLDLTFRDLAYARYKIEDDCGCGK